MMLNVGDTAPEFELPDDQGHLTRLAPLLSDGPLILFFYPADFTPVCTAEACEIRDIHPKIQAVNATVVGISPQSEASHARFRARYDLPYKLLFDQHKKVIRAYGVDGFLGMGVRRVTYLINQDKKIKKRVIADFVVKQHIRFIEEVVQDLGGY